MGPELHEIAPEQRQGWAISRRRKLAAAIVGVMMLGMGLDASHSTAPVSLPDDDTVTVDEFDRIEALLGKTETAKAAGRGPTVEVPNDLAMNVERPSFDFAAFDDMNARQSQDKLSSREGSPAVEDITTNPPARESFDVESKRQELQIPEAMALTGQRGGLAEKEVVDAKMLDAANADVGLTMILAGPKSKSDSQPVQIITSDVTTSTVTRFDQVDKTEPDEDTGKIRFTGSIFPVSRPGSSR